MATLAELVNRGKEQSQSRLTFVKSASQLNISPEVDLRSSEFHSLKVSVRKFPLVFAAGASEDGPLVIDYNFDKVGKLECGFTPKIVVLSGINAARKAKDAARKSNIQTVSAWVGNRAIKAMSISAANVSVNDLQALIYKAVQEKYGKKDKIGETNYSESPYVVDVFIFDSYCILGYKGSKYRQPYTFDQKTRSLTLDGDMIPVVEEFIDAPAPSIKAMSLAQTLYDTPNSAAPALGGFNGPNKHLLDSKTIIDFGAPGSEANTPMLKLMLNVEEALKTYLVEITKGVHKVIYPGTVTPPNMLSAAKEAMIAVKELPKNVAASVSIVDFIRWQDKKLNIKASQQTKMVNGEQYGSEDFAYVGDPRDISTWFIPLRTSSQIIHASKDQLLYGVPKDEKRQVKENIQAAMVMAKGTYTSGKSTKGNPHKFVKSDDGTDMCKACSMSSEHPLHKVK